MNQLTNIHELIPVMPELVLAGGAMLLLMIGAYAGEGSARFVNTLSIVLIAVVAVLLIQLPSGRLVMFNGSFVVDDFARFLKLLMLCGSAGTLMLSLDYLTAEKQQRFEFGVLVLLATLGMMLLISANDLIALYLGLELMSLPLYVIASSNRDNARSTEAGLKYFVLGALSSGMLLVWRVLDLRLHRDRELCRYRQGDAGRRRPRADLRPGVHVRRLLLQGLGGAVPHVDAGRL